MKSRVLILITALIFAFSGFTQVNNLILQPGPSNGKDAVVRSNLPSNNYGSTSWMTIRRWQSWNITNRIFIEFDLTTIPQNAIILDADLSIFRYAGLSSVSPLEVNKVTQSWAENTITWSNAPNVTNVDMKTQPVNGINNFFHTINVTSHVQEFVNYPHLNLGWRLKCQDESSDNGSHYRTSEYTSIPVHRPKLVISYVLPIEIALSSVTHASDPSSSNGSITASVSGGDGSYTYQWIDGATGNNISGATGLTLNNVSPGWYGIEVTDGEGIKGYMAYLVGAECGEVEIEFQLDERFVDFTRVRTGFDPNNSNYDDVNLAHATLIGAEKRFGIGTNFYEETLYKNRLIIPNNIHLASAIQYFDGSFHVFSSGNQTRLDNIIEPWIEDVVTWSIRPSYGSVITTIPSSTSTHQDINLNLTNLYKDFQDGTAVNHGQSFVLDYSGYPSSTTNRRMRYIYNSSSNPADQPKLVVKIGAPCLENYAEPKRQLNSSYYYTQDGFLNVKFWESYNPDSLTFRVYNSLNQNISNGNALVTSSIETGSNLLVFNFDTGGQCLQDGFYILEIEDAKGNIRRLRFKKSNSSC
jgi:hypothetical protein